MRIIHDSKYCTGCKACVIACLESHQAPLAEKRCDIFLKADQKAIVKFKFKVCVQCADPKCVDACPHEALKKDTLTGAVFFDITQCMQCKKCIIACPFEAIGFSEKSEGVVKCDICMNNGQNAPDPSCVSACPYGCLKLK